MKVTVNFGAVMNSWYDVTGMGADLRHSYGKDDVIKNGKHIRSIMDKEIEGPLEGDASRMWIGGFSQGGCMALHVGLSHEKLLGGIIACSCALFDITKIEAEEEKKEKLPVFTYHG